MRLGQGVGKAWIDGWMDRGAETWTRDGKGMDGWMDGWIGEPRLGQEGKRCINGWRSWMVEIIASDTCTLHMFVLERHSTFTILDRSPASANSNTIFSYGKTNDNMQHQIHYRYTPQ